MKFKMREEDRRAVDLLLDRATAASQGRVVYSAADGHTRERIAKVEKVLSVLENLPAAEPPRDLAARTLKFIKNASTHEGAAPPRPQPFNNTNHPFA